MTEGLKTLTDIKTDIEMNQQRLSLLEADLLGLHEKEWVIRTELQHLEIQRERLEGVGVQDDK